MPTLPCPVANRENGEKTVSTAKPNSADHVGSASYDLTKPT